MSIRHWLTAFMLTSITLLTGCLKVEVSVPETITQHEAFEFTSEVTPASAEGLVYSWTLDGQVISSLDQGYALLAEPGMHTLTVDVTDDRDREATQTIEFDVAPAMVLNQDFEFTILVSDLTGYAVEGVNVTVNGAQLTTDATGTANFTGIPLNPVMVVTAEKAGYLDQSYRYEFTGDRDDASVVLTMSAKAAPIAFNNSTPSTVETDALNTQISLPANAFIDAEGNPVTGDIDLAMTPIDIRQIGAAFPGGGQALTADGEVVALVTTGMIDFDFSQNGQPLQLAPGTAADIEMDLVSNIGADGRILVEGDTIEMWWFNTSSGLWVEEGSGSIVASATSPTGLKLIATVNHFTTWNWDYYKQDDRASFVLNCTREGQILTAAENCFVRVVGGTLNRSFTLDSAGVTAINLPPNVTFNVYADLVPAGNPIFRGTTSFTTVPGTVNATVDLQPYPTDIGTVTCFITDGTNTAQVSCSGTANGTTGTYEYFSTDPLTNTAEFSYVTDETVTVTASIQGFTESAVIDTSLLAGALNVQLTAVVEFGQVTCFATLDGATGEYFPCEGVVTDDLIDQTVFTAADFSGNPLTGVFAYNDAASVLTVQVANAINGASVEVYNNGDIGEGQGFIFINGVTDDFIIDLNIAPAVVNATYDIASADLYTVSCLAEGVALEPCNVNIYTQFEEQIYRGTVGETNPLAPSWLGSQIVITDIQAVLDGFAYADAGDRNQDGGELGEFYYSTGYTVDPVAQTIVFTMESYGVIGVN